MPVGDTAASTSKTRAKPRSLSAKQGKTAKPGSGETPGKKAALKQPPDKLLRPASAPPKGASPKQAAPRAGSPRSPGPTPSHISKAPKTPASPHADKLRTPVTAPAPEALPAPDRQRVEQAAKAERQSEQRQAEYYEKGIAHFNVRKFARALPLLEKAAEGPNTALRHRAHVYSEICRKQIGNQKVDLKTAEDHYNYGVRLMNDRRLTEAEHHLQRALRLAPKAAYVHYANGVLSALQGNTESAFGHLKRAIEIDPLNRVLALNDADLAGVAGRPPIARLLREGD